MTISQLAALLRKAEKAHKASGHSAKDWDKWYAKFMLPKLQEVVTAKKDGDRASIAWG